MKRSAQADAAGLSAKLDASTGVEKLRILVELSRIYRQSDMVKGRSRVVAAVELGRELLAQGTTESEKKLHAEALGEALLARADFNMSNNQLAAAEVDYREARELFAQVNARPQIVLALLGTSWVLRTQLKMDAAAECIKQAANIASEHDNTPETQALILTEQALYHCDLGEDEAARTAIKSAEAAVLKVDDVYLQVRVLHSYASIVARQGDFGEAIDYYERLLPIVRREGFSYALLAVLNNLGIALEARNQYARALQMTEELVQVARDCKFEVLEADGLNTLGAKYQRYGEYDSATTALNASIVLARKFGNRLLEMNSLALLGSAYIGGGDKHRGMQYLAQAADIFFDIELIDNIDLIGVVRELVDHLPDNCPPQKLIDFLRAGQKLNYNSGLSVPMRLSIYLGVLLEKTGQTEEAREELKAALNMSRNFESACLQSEALLRMGELENRHGQQDLAGQYLRHALFASVECRDWLIKRRIHLALVAHFEQTGDYERALEQHAAMSDLDRNVLLSRVANRVERLTKADTLRELQQGIDDTTTQIRLYESSLEDKTREEQEQTRRNEQRAAAYKQLRDVLKQTGVVATADSELSKWRMRLADALALFPTRQANAVSPSDSRPQGATAEKQVFVEVLSRRFPTLTKQEVRVAELVRLRTSTKEVARILRISTRAAETYRFRIRRKLELARGDDLAVTLAALHDQSPGMEND